MLNILRKRTRPGLPTRCLLCPRGALLLAMSVTLLFASLACGSDSRPEDSPTAGSTTAPPSDEPQATSTPTVTSAGPTVTFTSAAGQTATLAVEIADTPEERSIGLMNRESLAEDAGMLFIWPEDTGSGFWMRDTLIPLSVAFIGAEGVIVDIQDMQPLDETLHQSPAPYRYAVEANRGWFGGHGIGPGDTVTLPGG